MKILVFQIHVYPMLSVEKDRTTALCASVIQDLLETHSLHYAHVFLDSRAILALSANLNVVDADCPSRMTCLNEGCRNPCTTLTPCGQNAECTVKNTLSQRTMVCMCIPAYVGDADIACSLRKKFHS